ncbi:hypothetical protein M9H77_28470 [Catharanthus roseus]|uniref:Uncharacterized protein n=1 Tax=Catharanthus roseus TaxID=4058 RepID=A0ACC0AGU6_CATRO|nr:hypothetical protein M9H77_28470 [Catharanthus roseus]
MKLQCAIRFYTDMDSGGSDGSNLAASLQPFFKYKMKRNVCALSFPLRAFIFSNREAAPTGVFSQFPSSSVQLHSATNGSQSSHWRFEYGFANNIKNVDEAVRLFREMVRMRPSPSVVEFNQLLSRLVKLKQYLVVISLYKDICNSIIPVDEANMNVVINSFCLVGRVEFGFSLLGVFFKRGYSPNAITFNTLLKGLFSKTG